MTTYIALLRGINISGQKKIKMADLKELFEKIGYQKVQTYIQSGNVVFESAEDSTKVLGDSISDAILKSFGFEVPVIIRTPDDLLHSLNENPFSEVSDISKVSFCFLDSAISTDETELHHPKAGSDEFKISGSEIYLHTPGGLGKTVYNNNYFERKLKISATTRNLRTIGKLIEMAC